MTASDRPRSGRSHAAPARARRAGRGRSPASARARRPPWRRSRAGGGGRRGPASHRPRRALKSLEVGIRAMVWVGSGPVSGGEPAVGDFGRVVGARGSARMRKSAARGPRGAARTAAGHGRVNTSPKGRGQGATGDGREEEAQVTGARVWRGRSWISGVGSRPYLAAPPRPLSLPRELLPWSATQ